MVADIEHKLIYSHNAAPVEIYGRRIIGAEETRIYYEEDGSFIVTVLTDPSDIDGMQQNTVRVCQSMLAAIGKARHGTWKDIADWTRADGAHVIGWNEEWGVSEFLRHDDGWTLAAFNGQVIRSEPEMWQSMPLPPTDI